MERHSGARLGGYFERNAMRCLSPVLRCRLVARECPALNRGFGPGTYGDLAVRLHQVIRELEADRSFRYPELLLRLPAEFHRLNSVTDEAIIPFLLSGLLHAGALEVVEIPEIDELERLLGIQ